MIPSDEMTWIEYLEFRLALFDPSFVARDEGVTAATLRRRLSRAGRPDLADRFKRLVSTDRRDTRPSRKRKEAIDGSAYGTPA